MNTIDAIKTRRSIRKYKNIAVKSSDIEEILISGMCAPSAYNRQPWEFIVVDDRSILDGITTFSDHASMIVKAPLAILILADKKIEESIEHCFEGCAASVQNMLLTIHEKGLGGVWTGVYPSKDRINGFKDHFKLPSHIEPIALIVIGYPDESPTKKETFSKEKIHYNSW